MDNTVSLFKPAESEKSRFMVKTYLWMAFALALSALTAWYCANSLSLMQLIWGSRFGFIALAVGELAVVMILSAAIRSISTGIAKLLFVFYSVLNGATLSSIFWLYNITSIYMCFGTTALMFFVMSIYGLTTKQSLARAGHYLMMLLIGVIIVGAVNMLVARIGGGDPSKLDLILSFVTVIIFTGLTAYDSQKLLAVAQRADSSEAYKKLAVIGALELYLDFINIFLNLLRIFGRSRD
ncbi:Bax inhibitor-1/YccA family protein [Treponema sp.]|jgi:hypothetical protein|uniref:Bax inhibitor-1/YccA family protein n=1 Tax=Treponema sp. TaxID=166 RepID=UPI00257F6A94|nr:Bax inhibitor-1/YccA family protein [Treponema sp.]MBE6354105.1 Bax inhibitor-1/YccA family protein [Treponema sp.]